MVTKGKLELLHWLLKLVNEKSYIIDNRNATEIKNTFIYQLYIIIQDDLAENKDFLDVTNEEFQLKTIETLNILKDDLPNILSILQSKLLEIELDDFKDIHQQAIEDSNVHLKVLKFASELHHSSNQSTYTVNDAIKILGYSHKASIYNHINKNNLKVKKISQRKTIIYENDLDDFIKRTYKLSLLEYRRLSQEEKKALHKN